MTDKDRLGYFDGEFTKGGNKSLDEVVMFDCVAHLECMSDDNFSLILENAEKRWYISIHSRSGRAKIEASLYDEEIK